MSALSLLQPENALFPIYVTFSGIFMLDNEVQFSKADVPINDMLKGRFISVIYEQFSNALSPIATTQSSSIVLGMVTLPLALVSQSVIVISPPVTV